MNARVPSRFQHPIDAPDPDAVQHYLRFLRRDAAPPMREQADLLGAALLRGDPPADAWVDHVREIGRERGAALLQRALRDGVAASADVPAALRELFAHVEQVPLWVDPSQLDVGCRTFRRTGPMAGIVLSGFSLMGGYRSSAVVKPLMRTGKLRYSASRRLVDTGRFVMAVTEPGGLRRHAEGFEAALHVRLMHASVRRALERTPDWNTDAWGLPINQADMLGTNLLFSTGFLAGCKALGMRFSPEEEHGVVHLWRYIGYLLGIEQQLLPATTAEAERAFFLVGASQPRADADSKELARALHEVPLERATTDKQKRLAEFEMALRAALSRLMLGDRIADELELPRPALRYGVRTVVPLIAALERARTLAPLGTAIAYHVGDRWLKAGMAAISEAPSPHPS